MSKEKGVIVIIAFLTLGILLLLGSYFLSFTLTESKIAKSQEIGTATYYLAEAGINQAIWKLKNDDEWSTCFVEASLEYGCDCESWSDSFVQDTDELIVNSTTTVSIQNLSCARGRITATSTVDFGDKVSQRVVRAIVFRALGEPPEYGALLGDGNVETNSSKLNIYKGNMVNDGNVTIRSNSLVNVYNNPLTQEQEGQVLARGNVTVVDSTLNSSSTCSSNYCTELCEGYFPGVESCPPDDITIPTIDFDSDDPNSYKEKARSAELAGQCSVLCNGAECDTRCIYTQERFEELLWQVGKNGTLTLDHKTNGDVFSVYYLEGTLELKGARKLVINGALALDGNVSIGEFKKWKRDQGANQITINDPGPGIPSGLLSKGNMRFGSWSSAANTTLTGLIYGLGNAELTSLPNYYLVVGGVIVAGNFYLNTAYNGFDIYFDNDIVVEGIWAGLPPLGEEKPPYSPTVAVEHWEESY